VIQTTGTVLSALPNDQPVHKLESYSEQYRAKEVYNKNVKSDLTRLTSDIPDLSPSLCRLTPKKKVHVNYKGYGKCVRSPTVWYGATFLTFTFCNIWQHA
jgi:hypothetical protein